MIPGTPVRWQEVSDEGRASFGPVHRVQRESTTSCGKEIPLRAFEVEKEALEKHACGLCWGLS